MAMQRMRCQSKLPEFIIEEDWATPVNSLDDKLRRWLVVVAHLPHLPNESVSSAHAGLGLVAKLVSCENIGFVVAALELAVITLSSIASSCIYHYFVLASRVDIPALIGFRYKCWEAVRFDQCSSRLSVDLWLVCFATFARDTSTHL